jgi:phosphatidate cytidylyltransferase
MALNLPTFYKRTGSAIVFGVIMLTGLLWNQWALLALVCLVNFLALREYFKLMQLITPDNRWPRWIPAVFIALSLCILLWAGHESMGSLTMHANFAPLLLALPALFMAVSLIAEKEYFNAMMQAFGGIVYITLPLLLLFILRTHDIALPIALVVMIWTNDTMAYLVGSFIGKTPFSPISPKKTWEGTAGGAILTVVAAAIYGYYGHRYHMTDWIIISLCVGIMGTIGDLLESRLKRMAGVKDSGNIMPGHGGAMDRFDSLLIATPFVFVYWYYFMA